MGVRSYAFFVVSLASCATVSGLADKEAVDCPGGCPEEASTPAPVGTSDSSVTPPIDTGAPAPAFTKPDGWELVAVANTTSGGGAAPACPSGFDVASDIGTSPVPANDACECTCNVTAPATCTGRPTTIMNGPGNCTTGVPTGAYSNNPAGGCNNDFSTAADRTGQFLRVKLAAATGGQCASGAANHVDRVTFAEARRVCDETSRCNGNTCDATVPSPFQACVASAKGSGDRACPSGFPTKLVAGAADLSCDATACQCSVATTPCAGTFSYYKDDACTVGAATIMADDTCRDLNATGTYARYKIAATTTTSCVPASSSAATVGLKDSRTVCCR